MVYNPVPTTFFDNGVTLVRDVALLDANFAYTAAKVLSVTDFGAKGNGVTNDLPSIQAAHDAVFAAGGGVVTFPQGTFLVNGSIKFSNNVSFTGSGRGATVIKLASASGLTGSHGIFEPSGIGGGIPAIGYYSKNNTIAHLSINGNIAGNAGNFYEGIGGYQCKDLLVYDVEAFSCGEVGLQAQVTNVGTDQNSLISFVSCISHDNVSDGFQVGGVSIVNCWAYNNGGSGIDSVANFVSGNVDGITTTITNCRATNNTNGGITAVLQIGPHIRTVISNCSAYNNGSNGIAAVMNYTSISNCDVAFSQQDGIALQGDYCTITGGRSMNNGQSAVGAANFRAGLKVIGTRNNCTITGLELMDDQIGHTQQYPIAFTAPGGGGNNLIDGCSCNGNVNQLPYQLATASDWVVRYNLGINPIGPFNASGPGIPTNPAVPATTVTKTNTYSYPVQVFIAGGTVTVIAINGQATGLTSGAFNLGAGETIAITYTVAPTWQWFGL